MKRVILENIQNLTKITLAELLNSLQANKQRRIMLQDVIIEGALTSKKKKLIARVKIRQITHLMSTVEKMGYPPYKHWKSPDAKCVKCNHLSHEVVICKNKFKNNKVDVHVVNQKHEDHLLLQHLS